MLCVTHLIYINVSGLGVSNRCQNQWRSDKQHFKNREYWRIAVQRLGYHIPAVVHYRLIPVMANDGDRRAIRMMQFVGTVRQFFQSNN